MENIRETEKNVIKQANYEIYQIPTGERYRDIRFIGYSNLIKMGQLPDRLNYEKMYSGYLENLEGDTVNILDDIYTMFNIYHPKDFKGHSLSISDVIVLKTENTPKAYYVDDIGFKDITEHFFY